MDHATHCWSDLDLWQAEDVGEDGDVVGMCYERMQSFTAGHGGRDGLQLVTAQVELLQHLQLTEFTEENTRQTTGRQRETFTLVVSTVVGIHLYA